jgi:hypothetical protein
MVQEYKKDCDYCTAKILMKDTAQSWRPFNVDGSMHQCQQTEAQVISKPVTADRLLKVEAYEAIEKFSQLLRNLVDETYRR